MRQKLTFDEALEAIADQRYIRADDVRADALRRKVWVAEWHIPGCLSESQTLCFTKAAAVSAALDMASDENGPPRGMRADLQRFGQSSRVSAGAYVSMATTTIERRMLRDIL